MAKPPRLVLKAYGELSLEPRQYIYIYIYIYIYTCKVDTTKDMVDGLVDFYNLVFYFI